MPVRIACDAYCNISRCLDDLSDDMLDEDRGPGHEAGALLR